MFEKCVMIAEWVRFKIIRFDYGPWWGLSVRRGVFTLRYLVSSLAFQVGRILGRIHLLDFSVKCSALGLVRACRSRQ